MSISQPSSPSLHGLGGGRIRKLSISRVSLDQRRASAPTIAEISASAADASSGSGTTLSPPMTPARMLDLPLPSSPASMAMALALSDPRPLCSFASAEVSSPSSRPSSAFGLYQYASDLEMSGTLSLPPPPRRRRSSGASCGRERCASPTSGPSSREGSMLGFDVTPSTPSSITDYSFPAPLLPVHLEEETGDDSGTVRGGKVDMDSTGDTLKGLGLGMVPPSRPSTPTNFVSHSHGVSSQGQGVSRQASSISTDLSPCSSEMDDCDVFASVPASPLLIKSSSSGGGQSVASIPTADSNGLFEPARSASARRLISFSDDRQPHIVTQSLHHGESHSRISFSALSDEHQKPLVSHSPPTMVWSMAYALPRRPSVDFSEETAPTPRPSWSERMAALGHGRRTASLSLPRRRGEESEPSRNKTSATGNPREFYGNDGTTPQNAKTRSSFHLRRSEDSSRRRESLADEGRAADDEEPGQPRRLSIGFGRLSFGSISRPVLSERRSSSRISTLGSVFASLRKDKARPGRSAASDSGDDDTGRASSRRRRPGLLRFAGSWSGRSDK